MPEPVTPQPPQAPEPVKPSNVPPADPAPPAAPDPPEDPPADPPSDDPPGDDDPPPEDPPADPPADPEAAAYNAEPPEDYELPAPPEGMELDPVLLEDFKVLARKQNLSNAKASEIVELVNKAQARLAAARNKAADDAATALHEEWGGDYDTNMAAAKRAMREFADADYVALLEQLEKDGVTTRGNDPREIKIWHKVALAIAEDSPPPPTPTPAQPKKTLDGRSMLDFPSMKSL